MPDPRSNIVKPCPPSYLPKSAAGIGASTSSAKAFLGKNGLIGKVGQVSGGLHNSNVGNGLITLSKVSDTIRQGCGSLPTSIGGVVGSVLGAGDSAVTTGSDWVLQQMGMNIKTADAVRAFNPQIANQAIGQAKQVFQQVKKGHFKSSDIPNYLQDFQNLERLGRNIYTPAVTDAGERLTPRCEASPYAVDLIARAPKQKFMFVVQFVPNGGYESFRNLDPAFTVQTSTRPSIHYQTEDINFYNFRTKMITRAEFEPMTMKFYDDIRNQSELFYAAILKAMTPAANFFDPASFNAQGDEDGMNFVSNGRPAINEVDFTNKLYKASTGLLLNENKTLFQEIRLYHIFDGGKQMDTYRFYNPRITDLKLDELSMAESAATMMELNFVYDSVFVDIGSFNPEENGLLASGAQQASSGGDQAFYSLKFNDSAAAATGPNTVTTLDTPFNAPAPTTDSCGNAIDTSNPNG